MAQAPIESGVGNLWIAKQSALGTKALVNAASISQGRWAGGILQPGKQYGSEEYVDGNRFGSPTVFGDKVGGEVGSPVFQAQYAGLTGRLATWICGTDTLTGSADPYTHTITCAATAGPYVTAWQTVGSSVGPVKQVYWDAKVAKLVWECGQDQKVAHLTATLQAKSAAEVYATDPTQAADTTDPALWTEVAGAVTFDAATLAEVSGEVLEIDTGIAPYYGDSIAPMALVEGKGTIMRTMKAIVTDTTIPLFNKAIYGTASPATGAAPSNAVYYVSCQTIYTRSASRKITILTPNVAIKADNMEIAPKPEGGVIDLEFSGQCLKTSGGASPVTITILTADSAAY